MVNNRSGLIINVCPNRRLTSILNNVQYGYVNLSSPFEEQDDNTWTFQQGYYVGFTVSEEEDTQTVLNYKVEKFPQLASLSHLIPNTTIH